MCICMVYPKWYHRKGGGVGNAILYYGACLTWSRAQKFLRPVSMHQKYSYWYCLFSYLLCSHRIWSNARILWRTDQQSRQQICKFLQVINEYQAQKIWQILLISTDGSQEMPFYLLVDWRSKRVQRENFGLTFIIWVYVNYLNLNYGVVYLWKRTVWFLNWAHWSTKMSTSACMRISSDHTYTHSPQSHAGHLLKYHNLLKMRT